MKEELEESPNALEFKILSDRFTLHEDQILMTRILFLCAGSL
jgi:hypothetical protein